MGARYANPSMRGDLNNYARMYLKMRMIPLNEVLLNSNIEPGYLLLNKICSIVFPWSQSIYSLLRHLFVFILHLDLSTGIAMMFI